MREIKFRAWEKDEREMLYLDRLPDEVVAIINKEGCIQLVAEGRDCCVTGTQYYDVDCELMQFTGLKDKNGVDIYEDDIVIQNAYWCVQDHYGYSEPEGDLDYKGCVSMTPSKGAVINSASVRNNFLEEAVFLIHPHSVSMVASRCKVIGNIHENPELLENKDD